VSKDLPEAVTRIFIVDDHPIMRQVLHTLLKREANLLVCGEAGTAQVALEQIPIAEPDIVLIDVSLPGMNGIELTYELQKLYPNLPLAILSGHNTFSHVAQAFKAGARGYILKDSANDLPVAIPKILRGERYVSPEIGR
jgi:DNA-binding NarL/FixJ family response regulator